MCDYSLHSVKSRPAKVGDKLTTRDFGTGTLGFAASEDANVAVCVLPGTELSFSDPVKRYKREFWPRGNIAIGYKTAIFRQIDKEEQRAHHDALEFPDGQIVLLTQLARRSAGRCSSIAGPAKDCRRGQSSRARCLRRVTSPSSLNRQQRPGAGPLMASSK